MNSARHDRLHLPIEPPAPERSASAEHQVLPNSFGTPTADSGVGDRCLEYRHDKSWMHVVPQGRIPLACGNMGLSSA